MEADSTEELKVGGASALIPGRKPTAESRKGGAMVDFSDATREMTDQDEADGDGDPDGAKETKSQSDTEGPETRWEERPR